MTPVKIRVYELARELGLNNKDLLALLKKEGFEVRSHSSTIEAEDADLIRKQIIAERQRQDSESIVWTLDARAELVAA